MTKKTNTKKARPKTTARKKTGPMKATRPRTKGPTTKNLDIYGAKPLLWSRALKQLAAGAPGGSYWLATTNPGGRPHVAAGAALWVDGKLYFTSSIRTRKGRNLPARPACLCSAALT